MLEYPKEYFVLQIILPWFLGLTALLLFSPGKDPLKPVMNEP